MKLKNHQHLCTLIIGGTLSLGLPIQNSHAEGGIVTDGTMGAVQNLSGTQVTIPQNLGTTVGQNLFHSFGQFNVQTGQTVTFTENTTNSLNNVISRVTGGSSSDINGLIRSTPDGHANFYLINPAGVVFGKDAQIDVPGAFHVSTANELKFADGNSFSANNLNGSSLSSVEPSNFGFLASTSGNNGLLQVQGAQLAVKDNQALDFVAGKIETSDNATLNAPGGEIRLVAMQGAGDVGLQTVDGVLPLPEATPSASNAGAITSQDSFIKTNGDGGGRIGVWGGNVLLAAQDAANAQGIDAFNTGATNPDLAKGVEMKAVNLTLDGARVQTEAKASGNAGNINVQSEKDIQLLRGGRLHSYSIGADSNGDTGNISLAVGKDLVMDGQNSTSGIYSNIRLDSDNGNTGDLSIHAGRNVTIINDAYVYSRNVRSGNAGDMFINANDDILIGKSSWVSNDIASNGKVGNLLVEAGGNISVGGTIDVNANGGESRKDVGSVNVTAKGDIILTAAEAGANGKTIPAGEINSYTKSNRDAAKVSVFAGGNLISAGDISSFTNGNGRSGDVEVNVLGDIRIKGSEDGIYGSIYSSNSNVGGAANGLVGNVSVSSGGKLMLLDRATIESFTFSDAGQSGNVDVVAGGDVSLIQSGYITSRTAQRDSDVHGLIPSGKGGHVAITSGGNLILSNPNEVKSGINPSNIMTSTRSDAGGGDVIIDVKGHVILSDNSAITSGSIFRNGVTTGNAGNITINVKDDIKLSNSLVASGTTGYGRAGNINFIGGGNLKIENIGNTKYPTGIYADSETPSDGILPANGKLGDAGNVTVQVQGDIQLVGNNASISSTTTTTGRAGDVNVFAGGDLLIEGTNTAQSPGIMAQSGNTTVTGTLGDAGNLSVKAQGDIKISGGGAIFNVAFGSGRAGNMAIAANNISFDRGFLFTGTFGEKSSVLTGQLVVTANNDIHVDNNSRISNENRSILTDELLAKTIKPGSIELTAKNIIVSNGSSVASNTFGNVNAGDIRLSSQAIKLSDIGIISSGTAGSGSAGTINFFAPSIQLTSSSFASTRSSGNGDAGNINFVAQDINLTGKNSGVETISLGNGKAGNVVYTAKNIQLTNGGHVTTEAVGNGKGGNVSLSANDIVLDNGFVLTNSNGSGPAGNVKFEAKTISVVNNSEILTLAKASGAAGNIDITSNDNGDIQVNKSTISSTTFAAGKAGDVNVSGNNLAIIDGNIFSASGGDNSSGETGHVKLVADKLITMERGNVSVQNESTTNKVTTGGSISVKAPDIHLTDSTISAETSGSSAAGDIQMTTLNQGDIQLKDSQISSTTTGSGAAGSVDIFANKLSMVGGKVLSASLGQNSSGQTGQIKLIGDREIAMENGTVSIENASLANKTATPGSISLAAPNINLKDSTITAESSGSIAAGKVDLTTNQQGDISLTNSNITSKTTSSGAAGSVVISTNKLSMVDGSISSASLGASSTGQSGLIEVNASKGMDIDHGTISIENQGTANQLSTPSKISFVAPDIHLKNSTVTAESSGTSAAGDIEMTTLNRGDITLTNTDISSTTSGSGAGGNVDLSVNKLSMVGGKISSASLGRNSSGETGHVKLTGDKEISIENGTISIENASLASKTATPGSISFAAPNINLKDSTITAESSGSIAAGKVDLTTNQQGDISLTNSNITSKTTGSGAGGSVAISANKLSMIGGSISSASLGTSSTGQSGLIEVNASKGTDIDRGTISIENQGTGNQLSTPSKISFVSPEVNLKDSKITAESSGTSAAGDIEMTTHNQGNINLTNTEISSTTSGLGVAGNVDLSASKLFMVGGSIASASLGQTSSGEAGHIKLTGGKEITMENGSISIENQSKVNQVLTRGSISLAAPTIHSTGSKFSAKSSGTSSAGDIKMTTLNQGDIQLIRSDISSTTSGAGGAGSVGISANMLSIVGGSISSASTGQSSSGETGHIKLTGERSIVLQRGMVSIENESTINQSAKPGSISLAAPDIRMSNSKISTVSSGGTSAGNVEINFKHKLNLTKSSVQTAAQSSNGGKITIKGGELFSLRNSNLTTTVKAGKGNGGDIEVVGDILLMDTAAIQANAKSGHGGDIYLNVKGLLPSGDSLVVGGSKVEWHPFMPTFNVIQAASETGVNGVTNITAPQLNLSGAISNFGNPQFDTSVLSPDFCGLGAGSTLTRQGHGGLLPKGDDLLF